MKTRLTYLTLLFSFLLTSTLSAQCPTGDVSFTSQAEVDAFTVDYPTCTEIDGFLIISGSDITDLSPLQNLIQIGSYLSIDNNTALTSLNGLEGLQSISGDLYIYENDQLTSFQGLQTLSQTGGSLTINSNPALTSLSGLEGIQSIPGELSISVNDQLSSFQGLQNLSQIGSLSIYSNPALTSLDGFVKLQSVSGSLYISDNAQLSSIQGLQNLDPQTIGKLTIEDNPILSICALDNICTYLSDPNNPRTISGNAPGCASDMDVLNNCLPDCPVNVELNTQQEVNEFGQMYAHCTEILGNLIISGSDITDLSGLQNLSQIGGNISIRSNPVLTSLDGLEGLQSIAGYLEIDNNSLLSSIQALQYITQFGNALSIVNNGALTSLDGLQNLTQIENNVAISNNTALPSLNGLEGLESIAGELYIFGNFQLSSIQGLQNLSQIGSATIELNPELTSLNGLEGIQSTVGRLVIDDNEKLSSIQGLKNLTQVGGNLEIRSNPALTSLNGLEKLQSVSNFLSISFNDQLSSIQELKNLTQLEGYIQITDNSELTSLTGLEGVNPETLSDLRLRNNPNLSFCALDNICTYLSDPNNPRTISGNSGDCVDVAAVQNDCSGGNNTGPGTGFITTWKTNNPGTSNDNQITIPTNVNGPGYNYDVYWVEIGNPTNTGSATGITGDHTITFPSEGTYQVEIMGDFSRIFFFNEGDKSKIISIDQWGDIAWTSMDNAFAGCNNLMGNATDAPDLNNVSSMANMFHNATSFNQDLNNWDVGNVAIMYQMFRGAASFNGNISGWDTEKVTSMYSMFGGAGSFNQDIGTWDVSICTNMAELFNGAGSFNQNMADWDISQVQDMGGMLTNSGLSTANYDATLIGWAAQSNLPQDLNLGAHGLTYCAAVEERLSLIDDHGWTILGDAVESMDCEVATSGPGTGFITTWQTDNPGTSEDNEITIPTDGTGYNYNIYWVEIGNDTNAGSVTGITGDHTITFPSEGTYQVEITGDFPRIFFNGVGDRQKILSIDQWGDIEWTSMEEAFNGASNLTGNVTDAPDLRGVTSLVRMFQGATVFNGNIGTWDVSGITNMAGMFTGANSFNQDIGSWDVSNVTIMDGMFVNAYAFNQDISSWQVGNVTNMNSMFRNAVEFSQDLSRWNVSKVTIMQRMLFNTPAFNVNIGNWDVSKVTDMFEMLSSSGLSTANYDATLIGWASREVQPNVNLGADGLTYCNAVEERQSLIADHGWNITGDAIESEACESNNDTGPGTGFITTWKTDNPGTSDNNQITIPTTGTGYNYDIYWVDVNDSNTRGSETGITGNHTITFPAVGTYQIEITGVFPRIYFNSDGDRQKIISIDQWGDIEWTSMFNAFRECTNLGGQASDAPDLRNVTDMSYMFYSATVFNQDIGDWDVQNVTNMERMFFRSTSFNQDLNNWDVSEVNDMYEVFREASSFNGNISGWNTEKVTRMHGMFWGATSFNQDISQWNVSRVTTMTSMFYDAIAFNQDIGGWNVSNVTHTSAMFYSATSFNQNLGNWDISKIVLMNGMLDNSGLSTANYDATLIGWAALDNPPSGKTLGAGGLTYCNAVEERQSLIDDNGWTFKGDAIESGACESNNDTGPGTGFITTWKTDNPGTSEDNEITIPTEGTGYIYNIYWEEVGNPTNTGSASGISGDYIITFSTEGTYQVEITGAFPRIFFNDEGDSEKILSIDQWGDIAWTSMEKAFAGCINLQGNASDAPILSNVSSTAGMFHLAETFNQDLNDWDLSNITDMNYMFNFATSFNGDISNWDVSNVHNFESMFRHAHNFNQDISNWVTESAEDMYGMFASAQAFNQDISGWNVSSVTSMVFTFSYTTAFNQDISIWDVRNVINMRGIFQEASAFNQNLADWDISKVQDMGSMFNNCELSTANYDATLIGWASQDVQPNVTLGATSLTYCDAIEERQSLIEDHGWTFEGDAIENTDCGIMIYLRLEDGNILRILTYSSNSFQQLKHQIKEEFGFPVDQQTIYFNDSLMQDGRTLGDFEVSNGDTLDLDINQAPTVANPIPDHHTLVNNLFNYQFAANTFLDSDEGDMLTYSVQLVGGGNLPAWLSFEGTTRTFSGTPGSGNIGAIEIEVTANDGNGGTVTDIFTLTVTDRPGVTISTTVSSPTNEPFSVDVVFSEAVTGFTADDINANNAAISNLQTSDNMSYTALVTPAADGSVSVQVPENVAQNMTGSQNTASNVLDLIYDNTAPEVITQDITVYLDANGMVTIDADDIDNGSSDANGIADMDLDQTAFDCSHAGNNTVRLTVTDESGNSAQADAIVTVVDNLAPVPDNEILVDFTAQCEVTADDLTPPTATDNCSGNVTSTTDATFPITTEGTTTITWTYEDNAGNTSTQDQDIIIEPCTSTPVAISVEELNNLTAECPAPFGNLPLPGTVSVNFDDNSTGAVAVSWEEGNYSPSTGTYTLTGNLDLSVDENPDNLTAEITVIVEDNTPPVPDNETLTEFTAQCQVTADDLTSPTATDNCSGTVTGTTNASFPITAQGTTIITWTYEDNAGNTSTQNQDITIQDSEAPVPDVQEMTEFTAQCEVTQDDLTPPTATDNCSGNVTGTTNATFPITAQGTTIITWTYEDNAGNTSTQNQDITIQDSEAPVPDVQELTEFTAQCEVTQGDLTPPTATDNCSGNVTGITNASFPITAQGTTTITWIYEDNAGNTSTQNQDITIQDSEAPVPDVQELTEFTAQCEVTQDDLTPPTATDNCSGNVMGTTNASFPITAQGTTIITWTYEDTAGNTSTQNQDITIQDSEAPVPDVQEMTEFTAQCEVTQDDLTPPTATDNCSGNVMGTTNASFPITAQGTTIITWTYEDNAGNTSTQNQDITIQDSEAPVPDVQELPDLTGECSVNVSDIPMADDNCAGSITATTEDPLQYNEQGNYTITWTYDDGHGNTSTQQQTVMVETNSVPVMDCPETHIVSCDPIVTFDLPETSDICGPVTVVQTDNTGFTSGSEFPVGITTLTFRASNAAGSASCSIEVEILPELEIQHISGIEFGDTLHVAACLPPSISKEDLDLGPHTDGTSLSSSIYKQNLPSNPEFGQWKISLYTYEVKDQCGNSDYFENYVALYDLDPPVFRTFPRDIIIPTPADLPPVPDDVRIIDICRYVVWDTVTTTPVTDSETSDTLAFVRRWIAEDEVGNKSFRDQMIHIRSTPKPDLNNITAHIVKEDDLIGEHFPHTAGTNAIPVTLYKQDTANGSFVPMESLFSGNWMGRRGNLFFTSLHPGAYRLKIDIPHGYTPFHPDSLIYEDGWSDTLILSGDSTLSLGSTLLIPTTLPDTSSTILPEIVGGIVPDVNPQTSDFTFYPNPTTGRIKIALPVGKSYEYTVYNHLGKAEVSGTAQNGSEIDLNGRADGLYFIRIENGREFLETKRILLFTQ